MMRNHGIETIVDVGGNIGSYGAELRESGYSGRIISFEPTDGAYRKLAERARADRLWTVFKTAIGEFDGEVTINVAANEGASSSLLPMLELHKQCAPEACFVSSEKVNLNTLNKALKDILQPQDRVLLKIDTQGYEHMVLKGASEILPQVELIECELSFVPLYDGQLLFGEMLDLLKRLGFIPVQMVDGFTDPRTGHNLQMDCIFARNGEVGA
jgi:FkbM family methyltransferase